jgi:hypothetical protein
MNSDTVFYTGLGVILTIMYTQRANVLRAARSPAIIQPTAGALLALGISEGTQRLKLYTSQWEYVFINRLNSTVGVAARSSFWRDNFMAQSDYHDVEAHTTLYMRLQPMWNAILGYTYMVAVKCENKLLMIPADLSNQSTKTFIITDNGLHESHEEFYREWSPGHSGQFVIFL